MTKDGQWHISTLNIRILKGYSSKSFHTQMFVSCMHSGRNQRLGCPVGKKCNSIITYAQILPAQKMIYDDINKVGFSSNNIGI